MGEGSGLGKAAKETVEQDVSRETGFLIPTEHHEANIHSLVEDVDQRHRIGLSNEAGNEDRQRVAHIAETTRPTIFRPILPRETQGTGENGKVEGLSNVREEWSNGHKRKVMDGLVRRTRIRRGNRSTARTKRGSNRECGGGGGGGGGGRDDSVDRTGALSKPIQTAVA
jgi:hypothetical protein